MSIDYLAETVKNLTGISNNTAASALTNALAGVADGKQAEALGDEFKKVLSEETSKITELNEEKSKISETQELIAALDKSILGSVAGSVDMTELSDDLLKTSGKDKVVEQLVSGHLQAIVTTKYDDEDEGFDITKTATGSMSLSADDEDPAHSLDESLEEIVERLSSIVAQI